MKPFRLDGTVPHTACRRQRIVYTNNVYKPQVKITDWFDNYLSQPFDNDPYHPINLHLQHYNRYGLQPDEPLTTTTQIMLRQILDKPLIDNTIINLDRYLLNYYSFKDTLPCSIEEQLQVCPVKPKDPYISTMQYDYTPPYPYAMERISCPKIPPLRNQKVVIQERPEDSQCKFLDDCLLYQQKRYDKIKGSRWVSYNPCTYLNTDGTIPLEKKQGCTKLSF